MSLTHHYRSSYRTEPFAMHHRDVVLPIRRQKTIHESTLPLVYKQMPFAAVHIAAIDSSASILVRDMTVICCVLTTGLIMCICLMAVCLVTSASSCAIAAVQSLLQREALTRTNGKVHQAVHNVASSMLCQCCASTCHGESAQQPHIAQMCISSPHTREVP
ncbi:hypothetical protein FA95DRAFT_1096387 [Auriscalpium vulgare]|uniref:Uncharacterized protein n=1 Tax=Auriscalpium vulgare TaxID=40419 RepID=A0ACB8RXC7_9AGAM|nr:hypothetical protein FA95DRAFT_1096387 [Auriscalpium vulgare]